MATAPLTLTLDDGRTWSFDAVTRIQEPRRATVTRHPIEDGRQFADHASVLPFQYVIRAGVTESPFSDNVFDQEVGPARIAAADEFLRAALGQRVTVVLPGAADPVLEDYVLSEATAERGIAKGRQYVLRLDQVQVASTTFITIPVEQSFLEEEDGGDQVGEDTSDDEQDEEEDGSILYEIIYGDEKDDS